MKTVVDLDLHEAIQDFGNRSPAPTYEFKSQDTIDFWIYFVRDGIPQDLGAGFAIKFGMIKTGDATNTLLAYQTVSSHQIDSDQNVYYLMQVNFNTSQMASAITGQTSLSGTAEIRYQDPDGEIIHSLNISTLVFPTILVETGVTPPGVSTGYPDASTIELLVHKNQPSGYVGLNASSKLTGAQIPVDGTTINLNGSGQLEAMMAGSPGANAFTTILAPFTTPAIGANVEIHVGSTAWMAPLGYVIFIAGAGYYGTSSLVDAQHINVTNLGYPTTNANPGTTIPAAALVTPGAPRGLAGADGNDGAPGANAYDTVQVAFTVPAVNATVNITITNTGWLTAGTEIFIGSGGGYYNVQSVISLTVFSAKNIGYTGNAAPGTTIAVGTQIVPTGVPGPQGPTGTGTGDMLRSVYDSNLNNVVDTCDALAWGKLTSVPATFPPALSDAETTAGVTLIGNLTGQIKRIIPGANVTLDTTTTPGGVIINGAAGGGGGIGEAPTDGNTYGRKMAAWTILPSLSDAETTSGITLLGSSAGQIKRLIAGSNVTLDAATTPGGVIVNSTASGGGFTPNHTQAIRSSNWTYADATVIPWTGINWDTDTKWSSGNPSRLTIVTAGYYLVTVQLSWGGAGGGATNVIFVNVTVNGSTHPRLGNQVQLFGSLFTPANQTISGVLKLNAADYLEVIPWNQTGPNPTALVFTASGSSPIGPSFQLDYLGT
jgi:hypothetical protein